jgi:hypothetical protein
MNFGLKTVVWWCKEYRMYCAVHQDENDNQVGSAGYGMTKSSAIADLQYQQSIKIK